MLNLNTSLAANVLSEKYHPRVLPFLVNKPERTLTYFSVKSKASLGSVAEIASIFAQHNADILQISGYYNKGEETTRWCFILDLTDATIDSTQVTKEIKSRQGVEEVIEANQVDGLLFEPDHFPLLLGDEQAIAIHIATMKDIFQHLTKNFQSGGKSLIYQEGLSAGRSLAKQLTNSIGKDLIRKHLDKFMNLYRSSGWGIANLKEINWETAHAIVVFKDNFECLSAEPDTDPASYFLKGHLEGIFEELFERRVTVREITCQAAGSPECTFLINTL